MSSGSHKDPAVMGYALTLPASRVSLPSEAESGKLPESFLCFGGTGSTEASLARPAS